MESCPDGWGLFPKPFLTSSSPNLHGTHFQGSRIEQLRQHEVEILYDFGASSVAEELQCHQRD